MIIVSDLNNLFQEAGFYFHCQRSITYNFDDKDESPCLRYAYLGIKIKLKELL